MHIYFCGIGGAGIGPLAMIAKQAGFKVSGSDKQTSQYITELKHKGIGDILIGQSAEGIAALHQKEPIDWLVYSSAVPIENPDHPELKFAESQGIKHSKRDELLSYIIGSKNQKLIAIAGTHGKTTTTGIVIWLMIQQKVPISYLLPAKSSFADMGHFDAEAKYFVYECDEFDRNFLSFKPYLSLISGIDWDHPDIYPTRDSYNQAFRDFIGQSQQTFIWQDDAEKLELPASENVKLLSKQPDVLAQIKLAGDVNRANGWLAVNGLADAGLGDQAKLVEIINQFPGVSRRFEELVPNIYTEYAHTAPKIQGALQLGMEVAGDKLVVVYEGLHNTRQHFIKDDFAELFTGVKKLYVVPSYLAREDTNLKLLEPTDLIELMHQPADKEPAALDDKLWQSIQTHASAGDLVLCISAGGGGSLDEWLRQRLAQ